MKFPKISQNNYLKYINDIEKINIQLLVDRYNYLVVDIISYIKEDFPNSYDQNLKDNFVNIYEAHKIIRKQSK